MRLNLKKIDDKTREYLIKYTLETREKLKNDNSNFESEIVKRELNL